MLYNTNKINRMLSTFKDAMHFNYLAFSTNKYLRQGMKSLRRQVRLGELHEKNRKELFYIRIEPFHYKFNAQQKKYINYLKMQVIKINKIIREK